MVVGAAGPSGSGLIRLPPIEKRFDLGDLLAVRGARVARHCGADDFVNVGAVVQDPGGPGPIIPRERRRSITSRAGLQRPAVDGRVHRSRPGQVAAPWAALEVAWVAVV